MTDGPALLPTQRPFSDDALRALLAPLGTVVSHGLLSGGTFSAVQAATLHDGTEVVVKTSVPERALADGRTPLLTYEHDMLRAERDMLDLLAGVEGMPSPRVLLADFSRELADVDAVVMTRVPGTPWDTVAGDMSPEATERAWHEVGAAMAAMHAVTGELFGYPRTPSLRATTWPAFWDALVAATIADADAWGVDIEPVRLAAALEAVRPALAEVTEPRLVHNDLWLGNVLLDPATGRVLGIVDFERALFSDPLQDLCGADTMNPGAPRAMLVDGLAAAGGLDRRDGAAGTPSGMDPAAHARLTLYRLWSMSVQATEIVPRGFHGDWVAGHRATIAANRAALFAQLGV